MIPSDQFVLFYNEIFKFLAKRGPQELDRYYERVAERQGNFTLDEYRRKGLRGVYDYYCRIRVEENCDLDLDLTRDYLRLKMNKCPSLAKALESDAGSSPVYCDHCPGWCLRVLARAGFWEVYDLVSRTEPVCDEWIYTDREKCRAKYRELVEKRGSDLVRTNLDDPQPFVTGRIADSQRFEFYHPNIRKAFEFLRSTDLAALKVGRTDIDGDKVFINVSAPTLKPFAPQTEGEFHRRYADIQLPIVGKETLGLHTLTDEEKKLPDQDDLALFKVRFEPLELEPGEFILLFPNLGGHAPCRTQEKSTPANFRKAVVKVDLGESRGVV